MTESATNVRKQKLLDVLFEDPVISQALTQINAFVIDHYPDGLRITNSLEGLARESSNDAFTWIESIHPEDRERVRSEWSKVVFGHEDFFESEYRFMIQGEYRWISLKGSMISRSSDGEPELYIAADRDITEERRLRQLLEEERALLAQLVIRDEFLNILNRRYLETKQSHFFRNDGQTPVAVLVLDIDNFKQLNTRLTHHGGDMVLQAVVGAIQTCLSRLDILARYGGDEFVLVFPQSSFEYAHDIAEQILDVVSKVEVPKISDMTISASIGLVHGNPVEGQDFWSYFEEADALLLLAKKLGKAQIQSKLLP
ncbi:GGDEF domain-containing protein [Marinomonas foliarum]|uniref:diguanylate cyclase n=1 Tax=Marinomonas foliarum TaxID=491950 RepID=A0A369AM30_9GAMM|nr:sensor domain-containing diguanylate cyclase [Marinomonas foliarum]RCX08484.1 PAS domain S-box-containing protein/diguanylate cyclase (GGDEF)-like protein [Marinomonas foliarum]